MIPGGDAQAQRRVGAAMLALIVVAGVFVVAILPRLALGGGIRAEVAFAHVGALREGAPVIVAGRQVGKVEGISLVPAGGLPPEHVLAATGGAIVHIRVDDDYRRLVPVNGDFFISSKGVLSDRYLEVGPPRDGAPMGAPLGPGQQVRGVDPPSLDRAMQRTWDNLVQSRAFLEAVEPEARALRDQLTALADTIDAVAPTPSAYVDLALRLRGLVAEADELRELLDQAGASPAELLALRDRAAATVDRARAAVASVRETADRLIADLDRVRATADEHGPELDRLRAALDQGRTLLARAEQVVASGQALLAMIERGDGSLMKLSRDPEFPEDAKELGKILKRNPWRIIGRPDDMTAVPRRPR